MFEYALHLFGAIVVVTHLAVSGTLGHKVRRFVSFSFSKESSEQLKRILDRYDAGLYTIDNDSTKANLTFLDSSNNKIFVYALDPFSCMFGFVSNSKFRFNAGKLAQTSDSKFLGAVNNTQYKRLLSLVEEYFSTETTEPNKVHLE